MKDRDRKIIARYRCGNDMGGNQHWKGMEEKVCRMCGTKEENLEHVITECIQTKSEELLEVVLGEDGKGIEILRKIEAERERREGEERSRQREEEEVEA